MTKLQAFVKSFVSSHRSILLVFVPVLVLLISVLFWDAFTGISVERSLWSSDGSPLYNDDFRAQTIRELTGHNWTTSMLGTPGLNMVLHPDDILKLILPPLFYHLASWLFGFLLMTGSMLYCLRLYGIKGLRAAIPSLAFGFSGYAFTLISAGHRGTPATMGYAVLAMALLRKGIQSNTVVHFVLAAFACVYGIVNQMDVMVFLIILIAAYGLHQVILAWPLYRRKQHDSGSAGSSGSHSLTKLVAALILAAVVFGVAGMPFFKSMSGSVVKGREEHIQSGGDRWEFITNWSLPPEQILEMIAPSVYGRESASRDCPYWGRLGQSISWAENRQGFRNFRQHNLYIGGLQIMLAIYAAMLFFRKGALRLPRERRIDIGFWWAVTVVTLLLAFGRYFPLYRIIYHIPMINNIRCPVKWFHITEISIVFLMGFGLSGLWDDLKNKSIHLPRHFCWGAAITAAILILLACTAQSTGLGLQATWSAHGLSSISPKLRAEMGGALLHGALVFASMAIILWIVVRRRESVIYCHGALSALLLVLAIDIAVAHKPFVHTKDVSAYYASNPIADIILEYQPEYRLADYLTSRGKHDPVWRNFTMKGVDMLMPGTYEVPSKELQDLFKAFEKDPVRLWQVTSTRFIIGQRKQFAKLIEHPDISVRASFYVTNKSRIHLDSSGQAPFVLLEYAKALPRVQLYQSWERVPDEASALRRLADPKHNPAQTLLVVDTDNLPATVLAPPEQVPVKSFEVGNYELDLSGKATGIMLINDSFDSNRKLSEGSPLICNAGMQGVAWNGTADELEICYESKHVASIFLLHVIVLLSTLIALVASKLHKR